MQLAAHLLVKRYNRKGGAQREFERRIKPAAKGDGGWAEQFNINRV